MEINKELLKGYIDIIILAVLKDKPTYGYELAKMVRERSEELFELKEGTMYLALKRLEKNNLIESYWGEEGSGGGRRKYYRILVAGIEKYAEKKREWELVKKIIDTFLEGREEG